MFAFPGKKGNCEFNFCVCTWLYVVCKWLTHLLRSFKCDCGKNSQFAIIRLSHLKSVLRYIYMYIYIPYSAYISRVEFREFGIVREINSANILTPRSWATLATYWAAHSRNNFNEIKKNSYSWKFRSAKYKRYTVYRRTGFKCVVK